MKNVTTTFDRSCRQLHLKYKINKKEYFLVLIFLIIVFPIRGNKHWIVILFHNTIERQWSITMFKILFDIF